MLVNATSDDFFHQLSLCDARDISRMLAKAEKTRGRKGWPLPTALKPHVRTAYSKFKIWRARTSSEHLQNIFRTSSEHLRVSQVSRVSRSSTLSQYPRVSHAAAQFFLSPSLLGYSDFTATEWWTYAAKRQKSPKRYSLRESPISHALESLECTTLMVLCCMVFQWRNVHPKFRSRGGNNLTWSDSAQGKSVQTWISFALPL